MEKVRIEAELPAALAAQTRAFVAEGCASDLDELLAEALRRFLESHASELTEDFMKEDVQWGLHGDDWHRATGGRVRCGACHSSG